MKRITPCGMPIAIAIILVALTSSGASADVIYRETFGNTGTGRQTPNLYGWQAFNSSGAPVDTTSGNFGVDSNAVASNGRPTDLANVNAGPNNTSGDFTALAASRLFFNNNATGTLTAGNNARIVWTPEYTVNTSLYTPGSIVLSLYLGDINATDPIRFLVRMGGGANDGWYYSTASFTSPVVNPGAMFETLAEQRTLTFDPTAANWQSLTFDGTYDGGGTPDVPTANKTAATVALASPGVAPANLSGNITAFGIFYLRADGDFVNGPQGNIRFDTYQIDATPTGGGGFNIADFNHANGVNGADLGILTTNFGTGSTNAQGNADGDTDVDGNDFLVWQRNVGNTSATAIPEPAALALLVVGAAALATVRPKTVRRKTLQIHN